MRRFIVSLGLALSLVMVSGCMAHTHTVGIGGSSGATVGQRQWYALWGLLPLNRVDARDLAGGKENYTVTTRMTLTDCIIAAVIGWVGFIPRTVIVIE